MAIYLAILLAIASAVRLQDDNSNSNNKSGQNSNSNNNNILQQIRSTLQSQSRNNTFAIRQILAQSNCGQILQQQLQQQNQNYTIFLPIDQAFGTLGPLVRSGAFRVNCRDQQQQQCQSNPFISLATQNRGSLSSLMSCIPDILRYHLVLNNTLNSTSSSSTNSSNPFSNITILETALNSTVFVNLNGTGQVLVANATQNGTLIQFGYQRPVRVVGPVLTINGNNSNSGNSGNSSSYNTSSGTIHLIDGVLIPPFPLNVTLQIANLTDFARAYQNNNNTSSNQTMSGMTVFAPLQSQSNNTNGNNNITDIDVNRYIIPNQVLYANSTIQSTNLTNAINETIQLQLTQDGLTYGNAPVIFANVPIAEGVLHILNSTLV